MNAFHLTELDRVALALETVSIHLNQVEPDLANFSWRAFERVEFLKKELASELFGGLLPERELARVMKILREEFPTIPSQPNPDPTNA